MEVLLCRFTKIAQDSLPIRILDCSFVTLNLCLLAAIKIKGIGTVRYAEVVLLLKIDNVLEQLAIMPIVRERSKPTCSLCRMASFSFPSRQTRVSLKHCKQKAGVRCLRAAEL